MEEEANPEVRVEKKAAPSRKRKTKDAKYRSILLFLFPPFFFSFFF
jgi:hypothetical protein